MRRLGQRIMGGAIVLGLTAGPAYFGQFHDSDRTSHVSYRPSILQNAALARPPVKYNPDTDPFEADAAIKSIVKKAKAGSDLETARKLHSILNIKSPGGVKLQSSGGAKKDDRPPRTAAETLKHGGDCSEFGYVILTVAEALGLRPGIVVIDVGGGIFHVLPFVEAGGKKYLIDLQLDEFGIGGAQLKSGKIVKMSYADAKRGKTFKFLRELSFSRARAIFHMESGTYEEDNGHLRTALSAFRKALEFDPEFQFIQKKASSVTAKVYNKARKEGEKAYREQRWPKAAEFFEIAISHHPGSQPKENKAAMHGNAGTCYYNAGNYEKAAEHYDKAFELTGNEKYKNEAKEAREKAKE